MPRQLLNALVPRDVIGFCYHTVSDDPMPHVRTLYQCKSVAQFRRDIELLQRNYRVLGYQELVARRNGPAGGIPAVVITFDDGLSECYDVVRPLLLEYGVPAIFFVTTEFLDNRRLFYRQKVALCIEAYSALSPDAASAVRRDVAALFGEPLESSERFVARLQSATWKEEPAIDATCVRLGVDTDEFLRIVRPYLTVTQLQALAADGFTIGAHGTSHQQLGLMTDAEARAEIIAACSAVAKLVPAASVPFAFPFNGHGVSRTMLQSLRSEHPEIGLFFDSRQLAADRDFVVNRLVVDDPHGSTPTASNLTARVRRAYARELVRPLVSRFLRKAS
jgi:peptidoglycan/xylan/chitin deacetylase (PgdA/CDA1 family)